MKEYWDSRFVCELRTEPGSVDGRVKCSKTYMCFVFLSIMEDKVVELIFFSTSKYL